MTAAVAPQTVQRGGLGLSPSDGQKIGVRRRVGPAIAIPTQRPAPAIERDDKAARVVAAVIEFFAANDGANGRRYLASPRRCSCRRDPDPCTRCAAVARLAHIAVDGGAA